MWHTCYFFLAFACVLIHCDMDFTYSASDLYRLVQTEQTISKKLDQIKESLDSFNEQLEAYRKASLLTVSSEEIIKNPILSYKLVKRHGRDLEMLDKQLDKFVVEAVDLQKSYMKLRTTFTKLGEHDLKYAMEAIVRIRQTYGPPVDELSKGQIGELKMSGYLSAEDLALIGVYAKEQGMKENAKLFLKTALAQHENDTRIGYGNDEWVQKSRYELDQLMQSSSQEKADREDFRVLTEIDAIFATDSLENLNQAFEELCQYHAVKEVPPSKLKCFFDKSSDPMRSISPLKIEVHHEDPQIVVIHDFLTDSEVDEIESATFFKLKRSLTQMVVNGSVQAEASIIRTTSQAWVYDLDHPQFGYLSKRIESVTGYYLSGKNAAEELQVASYRPGGHYSLHTDALHEELLRAYMQPIDYIQGDRVATFMVYLSDVEMGGNTAFPMLSVSVKPLKGSAILWGNLYPDGEIARFTLHGACPVVYGIKNIATKWIRANDQMFTRQNCKPDKTADHFKLRH